MMMWLFFWFIKAIPATFWLILAIAGVAVFFAAGILGKLPPFKAYTFWIKPLSVIAAVFGIYMYGGASINDHYQKMIHELEEKVKIAEQKSQTVNTVIEERVKLQKQVIKDTQIVYQDRIIEVAKEIDAQCKLDPRVPILHNDAATNPIKSEETKK
jgi:hypothetical protein